MIPLPSKQSILFQTVPVQKKRRISYDDTDTDSDNNTDTATATPRRLLFQQSPPRLPCRRPVLVTTEESTPRQSIALQRLLFQQSPPRLPRRQPVLVATVAATVATEEYNPRQSIVLRRALFQPPSIGCTVVCGSSRPSDHRRHSTRKVTKTDRLVDQRPKSPLFLDDDDDDDDNDEKKGT